MNANEVLANRAGEMLGEPRGTLRARAPERSRQHGPVDQRRVPDGDAAGAAARRRRRSSTRRAQLADEPRAQGATSSRRAEDRPHASAGRRADHARPGVRRLRRVHPRAAPTMSARASEQLHGAEHRRDRGRHRPERRRRLPPTLVVEHLRALHRPRAEAGATTCSASRRAWATCSRIRARCGGSRSSSARSRATCGCSAWDRAPGSSEIALPAVQPGSSIMPGKVNPSVPEMVNQVCFQVMGCDTTVALACEAGQLELNVMMPVIAWNALHASTILREAMQRAAHAMRRRHRRRRRRARASCSTAAPRPPPRSARTSATRRPRRSRRSRCETGRSDSRARARARAARRRRSSTRFCRSTR